MGGKSTEKGVMNGILDGMKVPAIWICNASCVENYAKDFVGSESPDRPRMNILLWGPPGSGKTEFVKYLGEKTGRRIIVKKGSDILVAKAMSSKFNRRSIEKKKSK